MDYTANVSNSEIDVEQIRTILVQGDATYPHIQFVLGASLSGLSWKVRGYYRDFNVAVISDEITPTETEAEVTVDWYVSTDFTTYYGEMQLVLVGTDALGETVVKSLGNVIIGRDFSISTTQVITQNLFEQLMAQLTSACLKIDQTLPQRFVGGIPKLAADRVISDDNELADKKYVDDHTPPAPVHNDLGGLQGGSAGEYYHTTQAQNAALHAHSNKTALDAVRGTNTGDQILPNRDSLGLDTDDTVTFANLSGTNTGDQNAAGVANTPAGNIAATTVQAAINELDTEKEAVANKVTSISETSTDTQYPSAKSVYNSTMRLLISRTIGAGENVSAITWTQDDAGNALALIDAEIRVYSASNSLANGSIANMLCRVNGKSGSSDYLSQTFSGYFTSFVAARLRNTLGVNVCRITRCGAYRSVNTEINTIDGAAGTTFGSSYNAAIFSALLITEIYLFFSSGLTYFPAGTVIEIYGRTA